MKQQLIAEILNGFAAIDIHPKTDVSTDIVISEEFLDAGPVTGKNIINYEAFIFADESSSTVYMYELTKESGTGFEFNGEAESSFQSGTTLFRKIKSIKYGPDGKPYEITLDLGAFPKIVKEVAKLHGWKFKTVLSQNKALYPPGYSAIRASLAGMPPVKATDSVVNSSAKTISGSPVTESTTDPKISDATVSASSDNTAGASQANTQKPQADSSTGPVKLQNQHPDSKKSKRKRTRFFIGITAFVLVLAALIYGSIKENGNFFFPAPHVSNACMAKELNSDTYEPLDNTSQFDSNSDIIYAASYIKNVSNGTKVSVIWHLPSKESVPSETSFTLIGDGWVPFFLTSDKGFPVGAYSVDILIDDKISKTLTFTVK